MRQKGASSTVWIILLWRERDREEGGEGEREMSRVCIWDDTDPESILCTNSS